ncbi:hypothetical protein C8A05DRAFT_18519, partial [Staphylotrichum tortipilum]
LARLDTIHRFTRLPLFNPYLRRRYNYGGFFRHNLAVMAGITVFIALVLTAMQVGFTTGGLRDNASFQQASYGFTIFAILGPICAFELLVSRALLTLAHDLSWLCGGRARRRYRARQTPSSFGVKPPAAGVGTYAA